MGLALSGPDVNTSVWKYCGTGNKDKKSNIENLKGTVIIGFLAVKGLSVSGAQSIINERDCNGLFTSLQDFSRRLKLNRDDIAALCPAGVFDSISCGLSRPMQARQLLANGKGTGNGELGMSHEKQGIKNKEKNEKKYENLLFNEFEALGFLRGFHPLVLWEKQLSAIKRIKASSLDKYMGQKVYLAGWPVARKEVLTKDGQNMSFLSLEDETAMYETVVFPHVYDKYQKYLFNQKPLLVYGRVTNDQGALVLEIETVKYA
jgi:DNA polymerase-3 subunit alpha/error-prone DNA polymerase